MRSRKEIIELSMELIDAERSNMLMMDGMYKMGTSLEWKMKSKPDWIREEISTDPFDALTDVADLYGTKSPKLAMTPYGSAEENRIQAERIEQNLMWQLQRMMNRKGSLQKDIIRNTFQYGRIGAQLVYLPYHEQNMKIFKNDKRKKAAMRFGPFALINKDPRTIFPFWSDFMLEGVLNVTVQPLQKVVDFWGEKGTKALRKELKDEKATKLVTQYDYWDYDQRMVWVHTDINGMQSRNESEGFVIIDEENELPFLPWIVEDIGTPLMPLLYPIWKTNKWETMNIHESALVSEVIAYIAAPRGMIEGPNPRSVKQESGTPGKNMEVPPGHKFQQLPPPPLDQNLTHMIDRLQGAVSKSTIPHSVQTADFGAGAAFASIRELIDLTTRRLNDGKATTERFFGEVFKQMLYWSDFTGDDLVAYSENDYGEGEQLRIVPPDKFDKKTGTTFDPNMLEFKVTLEADVPEDQVAMANAAQLSLQFGISPERAQEMVGISNPQKEVLRRRSYEQKEAEHKADLMLIEGEAQLKLEEASIKMQMSATQQQGTGQPPGPPPQPGAPGAGVGGQGFNPAMRGTPPAVANPGATREAQKGRGV